jgi:hypothetical protein
VGDGAVPEGDAEAEGDGKPAAESALDRRLPERIIAMVR